MNLDTPINTEEKGDDVNEHQPLLKKDTQKSKDDNFRDGSLFSAIFNFTNAPMGAGMLSFPYTFYCTGFIAGIIISLVVVVLTFITLYILIEVSFMAGGMRSYQQCIGFYLGKFWKKVCEIILLFYATGICVVYIVVLSQFIKPVMDLFVPGQELFFNDHYVITMYFAIVVIFPFVLFRKISKLGFTSFIALGGALYLCFFMFGTGISHIVQRNIGPNAMESPLLWIQTKLYPHSYYPFIFLAIPLKCFGYQNHVLVFPITYEVRKGTTKKMLIVMVVGLTLITSVYMTTGIWGWLAFGTDVKDNILNNFAGDDVFADICRIGCGINIVFSLPVQNYAARLAIKSIFWGDTNKRLGSIPFLLISLFYFGLVVVIALFVPGISLVFAFIGAIGAVTLMFFFPALLAWKVMAEKYKKHRWWWRSLSIFLFGVAVFFCVTGVIAAVFKLITAFDSESGIH